MYAGCTGSDLGEAAWKGLLKRKNSSSSSFGSGVRLSGSEEDSWGQFPNVREFV